MMLSELLEQLKTIQEEHPDVDMPVHIVTQPRWPMTYTVGSVKAINSQKKDAEDDLRILNEAAEVEEMDDESRESFEQNASELQDIIHNSVPIIYIGEGAFAGYGSSDMWSED